MIQLPAPVLSHCRLFQNMTPEEVQSSLLCCGARLHHYDRGASVFFQGDDPGDVLVLVNGTVAIGNDTALGEQRLIAVFRQPGDLFGEVFSFLPQHTYDHFAMTQTSATVLHIPRTFLFHNCSRQCAQHELLISNMLSVLAEKAYLLSRRLQIVTGGTLRQKIIRTLLLYAEQKERTAGQKKRISEPQEDTQNAAEPNAAVAAPGTAGTTRTGSRICLSMNREELASFLGAARPSISRELMHMQRDGLICIEGRTILLLDPNTLRDLS